MNKIINLMAAAGSVLLAAVGLYEAGEALIDATKEIWE